MNKLLLCLSCGTKVFSFNLPQVFGCNKNFRVTIWWNYVKWGGDQIRFLFMAIWPRFWVVPASPEHTEHSWRRRCVRRSGFLGLHHRRAVHGRARTKAHVNLCWTVISAWKFQRVPLTTRPRGFISYYKQASPYIVNIISLWVVFRSNPHSYS